MYVVIDPMHNANEGTVTVWGFRDRVVLSIFKI